MLFDPWCKLVVFEKSRTEVEIRRVLRTYRYLHHNRPAIALNHLLAQQSQPSEVTKMFTGSGPAMISTFAVSPGLVNFLIGNDLDSFTLSAPPVPVAVRHPDISRLLECPAFRRGRGNDGPYRAALADANLNFSMSVGIGLTVG